MSIANGSKEGKGRDAIVGKGAGMQDAVSAAAMTWQ